MKRRSLLTFFGAAGFVDAAALGIDPRPSLLLPADEVIR